MMTIAGNFPESPATERALVILEDRDYTYMLKLEVLGELSAGDFELLREVVDSIHPVPSKERAEHDAFIHCAA